MIDVYSVLVIGLNLSICTCYLVLASLLDAEFEKRKLESYTYGYIIGIYSFSSLACGFCVSWFIEKFGRSKIMYIGIILLSITVSCMGMITYIEDNTMMITAALFLRACHGFFKVFIQIPSYSINVILHPEDRYKYIGIMESACNLGSAIGPAIGSLLYSLFGYSYMFIIMSLCFFIYLPLMILFSPPNIDEDNEEEASLNQFQDSSSELVTDVSIFQILCSGIILMLSISLFLTVIAFTYYEPVLSFRISEFTDSVTINGLVYSCILIGYAVTAMFVQCFSKLISPITLISLGLLFCGISNFMIGPSLFLPNNIFLIASGLFFSGLSMTFAIVPQLPMMLDYAESKYASQKRKASDMCSIIFNFMYSFGQFVGPIYGGYATYLIGYRTCCDIIGVTMVLFSIIFYILGHRYSLSLTTVNSKASIATTNRSYKSSSANNKISPSCANSNCELNSL